MSVHHNARGQSRGRFHALPLSDLPARDRVAGGAALRASAERFVSALVRPLVWLFIFAAGFRQILGVSIIPPYESYVLYEVYVTPGLMAMIQLFNGMQSSLSLVYDREMGNMRMLLVSPFPRWFLLLCKLMASTAVSVLQVYAYLVVARLWGIEAPIWGYVAVLPALVLSGLMLGALGMLLSSVIKQLENFAGVMNFVIFPMFFASSALYPLWLVQQSSPVVYTICRLNPFTYAVELDPLRAVLEVDWLSLRSSRFHDGGVHDRRHRRLRSGARSDRSSRRRCGMTSLRTGVAGVALVVALGAAEVAWSAPPGPRDPDWPCQQIEVPQLSVAAVWSGPPLDAQQDSWREKPQVADLVHEIAQRRVPIEQAQVRIRAFVDQATDKKQPALLELFAGLFSVLDDERSAVIAGLDRFGSRQKELAAALRNDNEKLQALRTDPGSDAGDVNQMTQRVMWEAQVFQDRSQSLSYACDVPGKIEQRLFALARTIQQALQ